MGVDGEVRQDRAAAPTGRSRRRTASAVAAFTLGVGLLLGGASSAWAGVGFSVVPDVPDSVTVGQTVPTTFTITNNSDGANAPDPARLETITFVPSCGTNLITSDDCPPGSLDRGVLIPSATGIGQAGTACAGASFTIVETDTTQGQYTFTTTPKVVLGAANSVDVNAKLCRIVLTSFVARAPAIDSVPPASNGIQTNQIGFANGNDVCDAAVCGARSGQSGLGIGTDQSEVAKATISIQTQVVPASITLGESFQDSATLSPPAGAVAPTGTITFNVYGNDTCTGPPTFTSTNPVIGGTSATSDSFTPTAAGIYRVIATYSGDASYNSLTSLCNEPSEAVVVSAVAPPPPPPPPVTPPPPPPPCTPPPGPAPSGGTLCSTPPTVCTPPPGPAPAGGELCARGTAAISGVEGCAGPPFRVVVRGRQIQRVVFTIDGKVVRTLTKPNAGSLYVLAVRPSRFGSGPHRVIARTTFRKQSGTKAKTLRVSFTRCARKAALPAFTG